MRIADLRRSSMRIAEGALNRFDPFLRLFVVEVLGSPFRNEILLEFFSEVHYGGRYGGISARFETKGMKAILSMAGEKAWSSLPVC